ncbi:phasin family protein [Variovorax ureilyticus]|uniref:Phasin family protein n=1 Tax=Variovorax ureilyticus TaxID=1836198 RepID=A0ABU8VHT5_9BURK
MATRRDETDSVKKKDKPTPARKTTAARKAAPRRKAAAPPAPSAEDPGNAKGLLRAGLKALGNVRDDVVKHQTNVIETLLGMPKRGDAGGRSAAARAFPALDIGLRKFEDVFDQRVAAAMQHLGLPGAQEIEALREQVRLLQDRVEQLERGGAGPGRRKR